MLPIPSSCVRQAILHNLRAPGVQYARPPLITQAEWDREYEPHALDEAGGSGLPVVPVAYAGFGGLAERRALQDAQLKEYLALAKVSAPEGREHTC